MATYNLKQLWIKACKQDGIDPTSKFVVFSKGNKWAKKYNDLAYLIILYQQRWLSYIAGECGPNGAPRT
jgi:hypothetical protein